MKGNIQKVFHYLDSIFRKYLKSFPKLSFQKTYFFPPFWPNAGKLWFITGVYERPHLGHKSECFKTMGCSKVSAIEYNFWVNSNFVRNLQSGVISKLFFSFLFQPSDFFKINRLYFLELFKFTEKLKVHRDAIYILIVSSPY